jgi:hypothetical protein
MNHLTPKVERDHVVDAIAVLKDVHGGHRIDPSDVRRALQGLEDVRKARQEELDHPRAGPLPYLGRDGAEAAYLLPDGELGVWVQVGKLNVHVYRPFNTQGIVAAGIHPHGKEVGFILASCEADEAVLDSLGAPDAQEPTE